MPKSLTLGNGSVLICLDKFGQVKDLYFHYAGLENHISENLVHRIGFWIDGEFTWLSDNGWNIVIDYKKETMASDIIAENPAFGITVNFRDALYNEKNIFVRQLTLENKFDRKRDIKVFFNQQFNIGQTHTGDTAYYDPQDNVVIHYKGRRVFLINAREKEAGFDDYSVGLIGIEGKGGTFMDAEDGELSKSNIEHGQVDSVVSVKITLPANEKMDVFYWLCIGKSVEKVKTLNEYVISKTPKYILKSTEDFWRAWLKNQNFSFFGLSTDLVDLFEKSLINIRTHVSNNGSIVASGDSDMLQYGRDTYSYMWPRDAAFSAIALAKSGDFNASRRFFEFCTDVINPAGYFMHKYRPDKSLGSSWHPWIMNGKPQLPIQEDETALVINALWTHFELSKDLEFIESIYNPLIKSAAEFMSSYIDKKTGLPNPSYDLWEMKYGIHTFTASTVYSALEIAAKFAKLLGKDQNAANYYRVSQKIKEGILNELYDKERGFFYKGINYEGEKPVIDKTVDISSFFGVYKFGILPFDDPMIKKAKEVVDDVLKLKTQIGGYARFEGDQYLNPGGNIPGNPWLITTLWMMQYDIQYLAKENEIPQFVDKFKWIHDRALRSGILSEQVNAYTGEQLSATPLIWSHAEFVITIIKYLERLEELDICKVCYPVG